MRPGSPSPSPGPGSAGGWGGIRGGGRSSWMGPHSVLSSQSLLGARPRAALEMEATRMPAERSGPAREGLREERVWGVKKAEEKPPLHFIL